MKRWTLKQPGRQNLKLMAAESPQPGQNEVLVRGSAVLLNLQDKITPIIQGIGVGH